MIRVWLISLLELKLREEAFALIEKRIREEAVEAKSEVAVAGLHHIKARAIVEKAVIEEVLEAPDEIRVTQEAVEDKYLAMR